MDDVKKSTEELEPACRLLEFRLEEYRQRAEYWQGLAVDVQERRAAETASLPELLEAAKRGRDAIQQWMDLSCRPDYDWNADPEQLTLMQGDAFYALSVAIEKAEGR